MPRINEKFGELVPDVFIGNIKIVKSYNSIIERPNARIDSNFSDPGTDNRYKNDLNARVANKAGGQLKVTVRLYLKEIVDKEFKTFWFRQGGIYDFLKIRVVQSLSSGATKDIIKNFPEIEITLHLHTNSGLELDNFKVGLQMGVRKFDTSFGGIGGSPFMTRSKGNIATEEAIYELETFLFFEERKENTFFTTSKCFP